MGSTPLSHLPSTTACANAHLTGKEGREVGSGSKEVREEGKGVYAAVNRSAI